MEKTVQTRNSTSIQKAFFIAHRGLSGRYPENTQVAFNAAWQLGCDGIELDVQVTKDGQVIVIHDPDTLRTSGEKRIVKETDWADLKHLNVGIGGKGGNQKFNEKIPLLIDVIEQIPTGKLVQIEIKHQIENMTAVIDTLAKLRRDIVVQVISFDPRKLIEIRQVLPKLDCFLVMDADQPPIEDRIGFAVKYGLTGLDIDYNLATEDFTQHILDKQLQLASWTINDAETAQQLIAKGVRYIASDFADELMGL